MLLFLSQNLFTINYSLFRLILKNIINFFILLTKRNFALSFLLSLIRKLIDEFFIITLLSHFSNFTLILSIKTNLSKNCQQFFSKLEKRLEISRVIKISNFKIHSLNSKTIEYKKIIILLINCQMTRILQFCEIVLKNDNDSNNTIVKTKHVSTSKFSIIQ